jgi:hypothetical protein
LSFGEDLRDGHRPYLRVALRRIGVRGARPVLCRVNIDIACCVRCEKCLAKLFGSIRAVFAGVRSAAGYGGMRVDRAKPLEAFEEE